MFSNDISNVLGTGW